MDYGHAEHPRPQKLDRSFLNRAGIRIIENPLDTAISGIGCRQAEALAKLLLDFRFIVSQESSVGFLTTL